MSVGAAPWVNVASQGNQKRARKIMGIAETGNMPNFDSLIQQINKFATPSNIENAKFRQWLTTQGIDPAHYEPFETEEQRQYNLASDKLNLSMMKEIQRTSPYDQNVKTYRGYWENPYRIARYYDMIQQMPKGWVAPSWLPVPVIETAYKWYQNNNDYQHPSLWQPLADDDPMGEYLRKLQTPPLEALTQEEQLFLDPKIKAQQAKEAALRADPYSQFGINPVPSWNELPWYGKVSQILTGPQGGSPDRPIGNKILASFGTALLPTMAAAKLGFSVGGPWGAVILGGVTMGGTVYQNITGEKVPIIGDVFSAMNWLGEQTEKAGAIWSLAEAEGLDKVLKNWDAAKQVGEWAHEVGATEDVGMLFGGLAGGIKGAKSFGIPGAIIGTGLGAGLGHEVGKAELGKEFINLLASLSGDEPAGPDEVWDFSGGYAEPVPVVNRNRNGVGPIGKTALVESFNRIVNEKEDPTLVFTDILDRFGDTGPLNNFFGQMTYDPIQFAAYFENVLGAKVSKVLGDRVKSGGAKGIAKFADSADFYKLSKIFEANVGEPLIDMLGMGTQQIASWLTGVSGSGSFLGVFAQFKDWTRTGVVPPSVRAMEYEQVVKPLEVERPIKYDSQTERVLKAFDGKEPVDYDTIFKIGKTKTTTKAIMEANGINTKQPFGQAMDEMKAKLPRTESVVPPEVKPVTDQHYIKPKDLSTFAKMVAQLTDEGLPKELIPQVSEGGVIGKFKRFFKLEPESQASILQANLVDSIATLIHAADDITLDDLTRAQRTISIIKRFLGVKAGDVGELSEQLFNSPYAAIAQKAIQMGAGMGWIDEMYKSLETTQPLMAKVKELSAALGLKPTTFLNEVNLHPDQTFEMLVKKGIIEYANSKALSAAFDPFMAKKSKNGKPKNMLPGNYEEWRYKLIATLFDNSSQAMAKYFNLKPDTSFWRFADLLKQVQNLLLLDVNIGYPIRNWMNNVVTRVSEGAFGNYPMQRILDWMERTGVTPSRFSEGFTMSAGGTEFTDLYSGIQKAVKSNDGLTKLINGMRKYRKTVGFASKWAAEIESTESARAYGIGMMKYWDKVWKPNSGYADMPIELKQKLSAIDPNLPAMIYAAIDVALNPSEIDYKLLQQKVLRIDVQNFAMEAAKKIDPNNPEALIEVLREIGATAKDGQGNPTGLAKELDDAKTPAELNKVIDKIKNEVDNNLTKKLADLTESIAEHEAARNKAEGPTAMIRSIVGALRSEFELLQGKRTDDAEAFEDMAEMDLPSRGVKIRQLREAHTKSFDDWYIQNRATIVGQLKAYGMDSPIATQLLDMWEAIHTANKRFYYGYDITGEAAPGMKPITPQEGSMLAQSTKPVGETPIEQELGIVKPAEPGAHETPPVAPTMKQRLVVGDPNTMDDAAIEILLKTPDSEIAKPTNPDDIDYFKQYPDETFLPELLLSDAGKPIKGFQIDFDNITEKLGDVEAARFAMLAAHKALGGEISPENLAKFPELNKIPNDPEIVSYLYKTQIENAAQKIPTGEPLPKVEPGIVEEPEVQTTRMVTSNGRGEVYTPVTKEKRPFKYQIVSGDQIEVSNKPFSLDDNENYPKKYQARDRDSKASRSNINSIKVEFTPDKVLLETHMSDTGPMVVIRNPKWTPESLTEKPYIALSGNGRLILLEEMKAEYPDKYQAYINQLHGSLAEYGLGEKDFNLNKNQRLVRVLDTTGMTDDQIVKFAQDSNAPPSATMGDVEKAILAAKRIKPSTFEKLEILEGESIDDALRATRNAEVVRRIVDTYPLSERNTLMDKDGNISQSGIAQIKNSLLGSILEGPEGERLLRVMIESGVPQVLNIQKAIMDALGPLAVLENAVKTGNLDPEYSISGDLTKAIDMYIRLKNTGMSVTDYLKQLPADQQSELTPFQKQLLTFINENSRSAKNLRETFRGYAEAIVKSIPPKDQMALLPDAKPVKTEVLNAIINKVIPQSDLFGPTGETFGEEAQPQPPITPPTQEGIGATVQTSGEGLAAETGIEKPVAPGTEMPAVEAVQKGYTTTHIDGKYDLWDEFFRVDHGDHFWEDFMATREVERNIASTWHESRIKSTQNFFTMLAQLYHDANGNPNPEILARGAFIIRTMTDQFNAMDAFYRYVDGIRGKGKQADVRRAWRTYNNEVHTPFDAKIQSAKMETPFLSIGDTPPDWASLPFDDSPIATIKRIVNAQSIIDQSNDEITQLNAKVVDMIEHPELYGKKSIYEMTPEEIDQLHKADIEANSKKQTEEVLNSIRQNQMDSTALTEKQVAYLNLIKQLDGVIKTSFSNKNQTIYIPNVVEVYVGDRPIQMQTKYLLELAGAKEEMPDFWRIDQQEWENILISKAGEVSGLMGKVEVKIPKTLSVEDVDPYDKNGMLIKRHITKGKKGTIVALQPEGFVPEPIQTRLGYVYYMGIDPNNADAYIYLKSGKLYSTADIPSEFKVKEPPTGVMPPDTFGVELHDDYDFLNTVKTRTLPILLAQLRDEIRNNMGKKTFKMSDVDEATNNQIQAWVRQVKEDMASAKMATMRYGEYVRDASLLNYHRQYGGDKIFGLFAPYEFWATRTAWNWAGKMVDKPGWFAAYARYRELQQKMEEKGMPSRLYGKVRMPAPYLPDWMGNSLYFDPLRDLFPPASYEQAFQQLGSNDAAVIRDAMKILQQRRESNEITQPEYTAAVEGKEGYLWESAFTQAKANQEGKADPYQLLSFAISPALYLDIPSKIFSGHPEKIGTLPGTRQGLAIQAALSDTPLKALGDMAGGILAGPETVIRKAAGLSNYGEWGPYYIDRMLSNMAAEGYDTDDILQAMVEKKGKLYEEASNRVAQEMSFKVPGISPIYVLKALFSGRMDRLDKVGLTAIGLFGTVFNQGLLPAGELKQRNLYGPWIEAIKKAELGDDTAVKKFFEQHPEYRARLALYDQPEERLKNFLVNQVWEKYYMIQPANRSLVADQLGQLFKTAFLDNKTRSYDAIDNESLAYWTKILGGTVPSTDQTAGVIGMPKTTMPTMMGYPAKLAEKVEAYKEERNKLFPNWYIQQQEYYSRGRDNEVLKIYPELKKYWNWNRAYKKSHPEMQDYWDEISGQSSSTTPQFGGARVPIETAPQELTDDEMMQIDPVLLKQLTYYYYGDNPLSKGAKNELEIVWRKWGKPGGTLDYFIDNILKNNFVPTY